MRSVVIFVASVFAAAIIVYLASVTQFTSNPFAWTAEHLDYAAAALIPVLPIAAIARLSLVRRTGTAVTDAADEPDPERLPVVVARRPRPTTTTVVPPKPPVSSVPFSAVPPPRDPTPAAPTSTRTFSSVENLAVASVLERGRSVADVAKTLKVRPATVEMWVSRARGGFEKK
jgi:hypothetical protein